MKSDLDEIEDSIWLPRDTSKDSKRSNKADNKKQSVNSHSHASSSTTTDESTLQLLDSVGVDKRVVIMDGSNRRGIVKAMKSSNDVNAANRYNYPASMNDSLNIVVTVELESVSNFA